MITHEHFLNLIIREPENAQHRLVYADWLEEQGDSRAEFLRRQVERGLDADPLDEELRQECPEWWAVMVSLAQPPIPYEFSWGEEVLPLHRKLVRRGSIVTVADQFPSPDLRALPADLTFLSTVNFGQLPAGPVCGPLEPFLAEPPQSDQPHTARTILETIQASRFRSEHIATLDATEIPWPGYHPGTDNDEICTDSERNHLFRICNDRGRWSASPETAQPHLEQAVVDGKLWYILLHPEPDPEYGFCHTVLLFGIGISRFSGNLIGVVAQEMCHNFCD